MEQTFFPVTRREAERSGTKYSSEKNKNAGFPSRLRELRKKKGVSQYAELAKQIGGLHIVDDYEYFHMKEYNIDKKLSEIVESILYCDADENVKTMKELIFDIY